MLLSPRPFGSRSGVRLGVIDPELRPPPVAIPSVRDTAHTFAAPGSSIDWALVMRPSPCGEGTLSTGYPVVTVALDCREIAGRGVVTVSIAVMESDTGIGHEEKSTCLAVACVLFAPRRLAP